VRGQEDGPRGWLPTEVQPFARKESIRQLQLKIEVVRQREYDTGHRGHRWRGPVIEVSVTVIGSARKSGAE
jgi:hypothetical protein